MITARTICKHTGLELSAILRGIARYDIPHETRNGSLHLDKKLALQIWGDGERFRDCVNGGYPLTRREQKGLDDFSRQLGKFFLL